MSTQDVKEVVRAKYGEIASQGSSCCGPNCGCGADTSLETVSLLMNDKYTDVDQQIVEAADLGLGCGTPLAFADMEEGMTVLDLGSGAGIDVFLAAKKVGPTGKAIGLDMTDEMLKLARKNKLKLGIENAHFWKGEIEDMPIESNSIDRILSNCVINLVPDKRKAFAEMYRVLKPGGKFTISDIVSIGEIPAETRRDLELWAGCVAGALDKEEYLQIVRDAGFRNVTIAAEKKYALDQNVPFGLLSITVTAEK
jgi:ubiquinone/menaquinone biosynthesis C-methylase UbiE